MSITSPASFLRNRIYEKVLPKPARHTKVSTEDFYVPTYSEWVFLLKKNYNVSQLKTMARYYKQKVSGNKGELVARLYNYLKYSNYAITVQKQWRGFLRRKYNKLQGPAAIIRKCVNTTDFLSLDDVADIPYSQFFSFTENGQVFGFSAKSLHNLILKNNVPKNPYTREKITDDTLAIFKKFLKYSKLLKENTTVTINNNLDGISLEKRIQLKAHNIFHKIDTFGHITDARWFLDLHIPFLVKLIRELIDIWEYRAQLSSNTKRAICPPYGNPFAGISINNLITQNITVIKVNILNIFESLISKSPNRENQVTRSILYTECYYPCITSCSELPCLGYMNL